MNEITVCFVTFARPKIIRKTIYGFLKNNDLNVRKMDFHIADNDTEKRTDMTNYIADIIKDYSYLDWSYTVEKQPGWGNNVNTALRSIKTDFVFLIEDDRCAREAINLTQGIHLLQNKKDIGIVRYDGIAGHTGTHLVLHEMKIPDYKFSYCIIDHKQSARPITYSNQPHLRHKRFTDYYGYYPENVKLGMCEKKYAVHVKRNPKGPKIAILADGIQNKFHHLGAGKSRQHGKYDIVG